MKITLFLYCIVLLELLTFSQTPEHISDNYQLVWQDEFEGDEIDTAKWAYRSTNEKRGIGVVKRENCFLDGKGNLVIEVTKKDSSYFIGQICTLKKFMKQYGYFECRAKMTSQLGPTPAFWLQSSTFGKPIGDVARAGAEIDIFEYRMNDGPSTLHHTVHWDGYGDQHQQEGKHYKVKNFTQDFHTFGLEWKSNQYIFYLDGEKVWSTKKAVSQIKQYIILSVELTGWGGDPGNSVFPDSALYDWVRVWEKK